MITSLVGRWFTTLCVCVLVCFVAVNDASAWESGCPSPDRDMQEEMSWCMAHPVCKLQEVLVLACDKARAVIQKFRRHDGDNPIKDQSTKSDADNEWQARVDRMSASERAEAIATCFQRTTDHARCRETYETTDARNKRQQAEAAKREAETDAYLRAVRAPIIKRRDELEAMDRRLTERVRKACDSSPRQDSEDCVFEAANAFGMASEFDAFNANPDYMRHVKPVMQTSRERARTIVYAAQTRRAEQEFAAAARAPTSPPIPERPTPKSVLTTSGDGVTQSSCLEPNCREIYSTGDPRAKPVCEPPNCVEIAGSGNPMPARKPAVVALRRGGDAATRMLADSTVNEAQSRVFDSGAASDADAATEDIRSVVGVLAGTLQAAAAQRADIQQAQAVAREQRAAAQREQQAMAERRYAEQALAAQQTQVQLAQATRQKEQQAQADAIANARTAAAQREALLEDERRRAQARQAQHDQQMEALKYYPPLNCAKPSRAPRSGGTTIPCMQNACGRTISVIYRSASWGWGSDNAAAGRCDSWMGDVNFMVACEKNHVYDHERGMCKR